VHPASAIGQYVGWAEPIGGIGPFSFALTKADFSKFRINPATGLVLGYYAAFGAGVDTFQVVITDGRGTVATSDLITVAKTDGSGPVMTQNNRSVVDTATSDAYHNGPSLTPQLVDPADKTWTLKLYNPDGSVNTKWVGGNGNVYWGALPMVAGDYPIVFTWTNGAGAKLSLSRTVSVRDYAPIGAIEVGQFAPISTATPVGTIVGELRATTPMNTPTFSLTSDVLEMVPGARQFRLKAPPQAGTLGFQAAVRDNRATRTDTLSLTVLQGQILDPKLMTLAVNPSLDNSNPGQEIGTAQLQGASGGSWRISAQSGFNPLATTGAYGNAARYQQDPKTGRVYTPPGCLLSAARPEYGWDQDQITLVWTSDDGTKVCQRTFPIPVAEAPAVIYYVGRGMKARYGVQGLETIHQANVLCVGFHPGKKYVFKVAQDADPDYYTDGTRGDDTKGGWIGPCRVEWMMPGTRPRLGGKADNTGVNTGITSYGKGHLLASHGDVEFVGLEVSGVHGPGASSGMEACRKDGNTYGNLAVVDCYFHDCDQGIESGVCHGYVTKLRTLIRRCGGASVGAGLTHNAYIGAVSKMIMQDCATEEVLWGHLFKSRARELVITGSRFIDSSTTSAACCIDICNAGKATLRNNFFWKGPMAANPAAINWGAEGKLWDVNTLDVSDNVIVVGAISNGGNFGPVSAVGVSPIEGATITGSGNQVFLSPLAQLVWPSGSLGSTTPITVPPPIARTDPGTGEVLSPLRRPYRHRQINDSRQAYPNFNGVCQETDTLDPRVAHDAVGAKLLVATATPDVDSWRNADGTLKPNPFGPGTKWAFSTARVYNSTDPTIWVKASALSVEWTETGDATVYYEGGLAPGGYFFRLVATGPAGAISDQRYFLVVE
jgi:hypothetical protein